MNKSILRISLCLVLMLSLSLTSVFAASVTVPYAEPPTSPTDGYISIEFSGGTTVTSWWHCSVASSVDSGIDIQPRVFVEDTGSAIKVTFTPSLTSGSASINYSLSRRTQSYVWLQGSGSSTAASVSHSYSYSSLGSVVNITYGGLLTSLTGFGDRVGSLNLIFDATQNIYSDVDNIYNTLTSLKNITATFQDNSLTILEDSLEKLGDIALEIDDLRKTNKQWLEYIFNRLELTNARLTEIRDILLEFQQTTLNESTDPLPNEGLNDYEEQQSDLKNESDVSASLDDVFNDADFGSFSSGFNVIWNLFERILSVNPILNLVLALVLTLGLVNLIFNRR